MAIRYSGDVEIRLKFVPSRREYEVRLRAPGYRAAGTVPGPRFRGNASAVTPEAYDQAAVEALRQAQRVLQKKGRRLPSDGLRIRRTFQSPCPL